MDAFASGRLKLEQLTTELGSFDMNEATTRVRAIDTLLKECLAWQAADITAEPYYDGEYVDYALGDTSTELIVEAKREGVAFRLPAGIAGRHSVDLKTLLEDPATRSAIEQVLGYCQSRGVALAAICNGHQIVAFYASRQDGVPPLTGRALVFSSIREMIDDFSLLWNSLSKDGVGERNLQRNLLGAQIRALPPAKLSDSINRYPGFRARTPRETDLKILSGLFIQDLENEDVVSEEFLRDCYCSSGALSQYAMVSKEILRSKYAAFASANEIEIQPVRSKRGVNPQLTADVITAAMSKRPLIVLGDVGVGKSMFVRHLIKIEASETLENSLVFYVNFGEEPALETNLEQHVFRRISSQLLNDYDIDVNEGNFVRAVYNKEINRFRKSIHGELEADDPAEYRKQLRLMLEREMEVQESHLRRALEHLRATTGRASVVVLDNIDQRPPQFQDSVFLIAQSLAASWPTTVFVTLRPSTFYESRSKGSLAAYQLRVFTVSPTRVDEVIAKRLEFAKNQLQESARLGTFPRNLSMGHADLLAYLDVLVHGFTTDDRLKELLDNLSGGNLRLALTYLSAFVGSGYVSTERVLDVAATNHLYIIPMHEFLRAIIFGEYDYFDPKASEICNLLDTTTDDGREHFLLPLLLEGVQRHGEAAGADGFVSSGTVYALAQSLGYSQEQVGPQVSRALDKRLLEAPLGKGAGGPYRITSAGSYMYRSMLRQFVYIDAVVVDTPITDVLVRRKIKDVRSIGERLSRASVFVDYLDAQWKRLNLGQSSTFDWPGTSAALREDIMLARSRADRRSARQRSER